MSSVATNGKPAERNVFGVEARLRLATSHNIEEPGFQAAREGVFTEPGGSSTKPDAIIEYRDLTVLGVELAKLRMELPSNGSRFLSVAFERRMSEDDALSFLQRLTTAWSTSLAGGQKDPWYGNLCVEALPQTVKTITAKSGGIEASLHMTLTQNVSVTSRGLEDLQWSPLSDIFAEGMRAPQPKSKYLFWFVVLEELEHRPEFTTLFTPMFSSAEKAALRDAVRANPAAANRLNALIGDVKATVEGRAAKLLRILQEIDATEIDGINGKIVVDEKLCKRLIEQRNLVAHKGKSIDKDTLYNVLFPLSQKALAYLSASDRPLADPSPQER